MPTTDVGTASAATDPGAPPSGPRSPGGCYRVQVLVVGHQKPWRDEVAAQVRKIGFQATACDRGTDAMTVLALGLPVDVLVIDVALHGALCSARLAVEARALRPSLRIVLASDVPASGMPASEPSDRQDRDRPGLEVPAMVPDVLMVRRDQFQDGLVARTVREALGRRAA